MDDVLPTYHEATARADWLALAGPYVQFADYRALCLVSRRFWRVFAPRLWGDILDSAARLGLDPAEGEFPLPALWLVSAKATATPPLHDCPALFVLANFSE